jgi:hypothetical protein
VQLKRIDGVRSRATLGGTTIICALRDPARYALAQRIAAQLSAELLQALVRTAPFQVAYRLLERNVVSQRRQTAIQQHILLMNPETFGKPERPGNAETPSARVFGN